MEVNRSQPDSTIPQINQGVEAYQYLHPKYRSPAPGSNKLLSSVGGMDMLLSIIQYLGIKDVNALNGVDHELREKISIEFTKSFKLLRNSTILSNKYAEHLFSPLLKSEQEESEQSIKWLLKKEKKDLILSLPVRHVEITRYFDKKLFSMLIKYQAPIETLIFTDVSKYALEEIGNYMPKLKTLALVSSDFAASPTIADLSAALKPLTELQTLCLGGLNFSHEITIADLNTLTGILPKLTTINITSHNIREEDSAALQRTGHPDITLKTFRTLSFACDGDPSVASVYDSILGTHYVAALEAAAAADQRIKEERIERAYAQAFAQADQPPAPLPAPPAPANQRRRRAQCVLQ